MKAILTLEDGTVVEGEGWGAEGTALGELVFATPFTGYEEALTDPLYKGQILMPTYPLIGNYGVSGAKFQSEGIKVEGFVVREKCDFPSHYKIKRSIDRAIFERRRSAGNMRNRYEDADDKNEAIRHDESMLESGRGLQ